MCVTRSFDDGHDHCVDKLNGMTCQFKLNLKLLKLEFVLAKCIFLLIWILKLTNVYCFVGKMYIIGKRLTHKE